MITKLRLTTLFAAIVLAFAVLPTPGESTAYAQPRDLQTRQEKRDLALMERVAREMQQSGVAAITRNRVALQAALDRMPTDYALTAEKTNAVILRSGDLGALLVVTMTFQNKPVHALPNVYGSIGQMLGYEAADRRAYDEAITHLDRVLAAQPNHAFALAEKIFAISQKGDCTTAIAIANEALEGSDIFLALNQPLFLRRRGWCQIETGQWAAAKASYEAALEIDDEDNLSRSQLAYIAQNTPTQSIPTQSVTEQD